LQALQAWWLLSVGIGSKEWNLETAWQALVP
jgi:hypothetical protein